MDIGNIKKHSDLNFEVAQAKKNALEKMRSRQLMAYNERLFMADAHTISLVSTLKQHNKDFYMLDVNENPCHIKDPDDFLKGWLRLVQQFFQQDIVIQREPFEHFGASFLGVLAQLSA